MLSKLSQSRDGANQGFGITNTTALKDSTALCEKGGLEKVGGREETRNISDVGKRD